ncbi:hypothetical protein C7974DRAFT_423149 [Boeremia exigua]|uniref:uncharacterized protein n=1 Tax=Boeremia exigua TaxID=749465 RepID=UPI001E8E38AD|nr:uncharacterized protein C7974DRAFT_423149 [Boeremia exigua]KAH6638244.1 hypothetical protein C7974DRAFT_423149 [Boeremia exigua]
MSSISTTPRRPSTAQPLTRTPRLPYEAGEALLWERQTHRLTTHLAQQLQTLQAQHAAYDARIRAAEAVAEAADAAVQQVRGLDAKVCAIEAEDAERPFDKWVQEAVGQLQVVVDGLKGVRGKVGGLEREVERLGEEVEGGGGLLKDVVRRVGVLEGEKEERREEVGVEDAGAEGCGQVLVDDSPLMDDDPLAVFYGIDSQRRQQSPLRQKGRFETPNARRQDRPARKRTESPQQRRGNLQPPDEDTALPEHTFDPREAAPPVDYGWENTQQYKDMQKELDELRAMCRTQESKHDSETADMTQRPQETLIVPREEILGFSDATTEAEGENDGADRQQSRMDLTRGSVDGLRQVFTASEMWLPSSPPKRTETQSARRNIMKRPSIHNPRLPSTRLPSVKQRRQDAEPGPDRTPRPSLLASALPPDETRTGNKTTAKRKRVDDAPVQRVTRPKLGDGKTAAKKPVAGSASKSKIKDDKVVLEAAPSVPGDNSLAPPPSPRKTLNNQEPAVNSPVRKTAQASTSIPEIDPLPVVEPAVTVAKTVKSRKNVSKSKQTKKPTKQPAPQAASSSKTPAVVKKEGKGHRQPAGACQACRARHQKCDRTHPNCGRCVKFGIACEYPLAFGSSAPVNGVSASPGKKKALLPIKKSEDDANPAHDERERSVTVSPEVPRQQSPAKRPLASPSKKSVAAPTAASSRAPRAKNTQNPKASPSKQKTKQK